MKFPHQVGKLIGVAGQDGNARAGLRQRDRLPDPAAAAGHERGAFGKIRSHLEPPSRRSRGGSAARPVRATMREVIANAPRPLLEPQLTMPIKERGCFLAPWS